MFKILATVATLALAAAAQAQTVTGNPLADGWSSAGNSLENGVYVRGSGNFSYTAFQQTMTLGAGSNLVGTLSGSTWNAGDVIVGIGGLFVTAPTAGAAGWPAYSGMTPNSAIDNTMRMVGKFGSSATAWGPSTTAPVPGNGPGSASGGFGGLGAITLGNTASDLTGTGSGVLRLPSVAQLYDGTVTPVNIDTGMGRMMYNYGAGGIVTSWQLMLNLTQLNATYGGTYADLPSVGDRNIVTTQRGTSSSTFTDALVPTPGAAGLLGLGGLAAARRRR